MTLTPWHDPSPPPACAASASAHGYHYEVKSGELIAPGIPELAERAYFADLASTYGKTFYT